MNADAPTTRATDRIAAITPGGARRIYFDGQMGDALTEALDRFARDAYVRVVVVTGSAPGDVTETPLIQGLALERNLSLKLCIAGGCTLSDAFL
jgi:hypothetical protein